MKAKHTPTPWKTGDADWRTIVGPATRWYTQPFDPEERKLVGIATVDLSDNEAEDSANAEFVVRAVNNHEALVKLLEEVVEYGESFDLRDRIEALLVEAKGPQ